MDHSWLLFSSKFYTKKIEDCCGIRTRIFRIIGRHADPSTTTTHGILYMFHGRAAPSFNILFTTPGSNPSDWKYFFCHKKEWILKNSIRPKSFPKLVGPWCLSSGVRARLLCLQTEFESRLSLYSASCFIRMKIYAKRGREWPIYYKCCSLLN